MSVEGETYEQWRARTAPSRPVRATDTRKWDVAIAALLAVFFVWFGGVAGWIGLGLVALLVLEQVVQPRLRRSGESSRAHRLRGVTLVATLGLSAWLVSVAGPEAAPLPLLLLLLDVKDERSFVRWAIGRVDHR